MLITQIKPHKIPERLIYTAGDTSRIFSTKTGDILGHIKTEKRLLKDKDFYPNYQGAESLYIKHLEVIQCKRRQGIGTALMQFAQHLSKKQGAEGRLHCIAWNTEHPGQPPHKFYRKIGFTCANESSNKSIDFSIKHDIPIHPSLTQGTPMFLKNFWEKIK